MVTDGKWLNDSLSLSYLQSRDAIASKKDTHKYQNRYIAVICGTKASPFSLRVGGWSFNKMKLKLMSIIMLSFKHIFII